MDKFRGKIFNANVFEKYLRTLESTKENSLIKNALFTEVNKYRSKMSEQAGGYFVTEPIKGRLGGTPVNYDGNTDITSSERDTFYQTKICFGRAKAWGEYDFTNEITGENFMAEASEVKEYWDEVRQGIVLSILKGIFSMSGGVNGQFVSKHTYDITDATNPNLGADTLNRASQKALGDKKAKLDVMYTHSAVSTNLEGLNLIDFLKYTDSQGIQRDLTIGTFNGRLVIVDDDMPTTEVEATSTEEAYTEYTSYLFKNGFFEHEDLGVYVPSELVRDAKTKGGLTELVTRIREMIVPTLISYTATNKVSPTNSDFETGSNWELANNGETSSANKVYVDDKLIPVARIISRG